MNTGVKLPVGLRIPLTAQGTTTPFNGIALVGDANPPGWGYLFIAPFWASGGEKKFLVSTINAEITDLSVGIRPTGRVMTEMVCGGYRKEHDDKGGMVGRHRSLFKEAPAKS